MCHVTWFELGFESSQMIIDPFPLMFKHLSNFQDIDFYTQRLYFHERNTFYLTGHPQK